jgi:ribosomal-protein-alanine N-acetyltransferase
MNPLARLAPMELDDIPQVMAIDEASFPLPWSASSYRHELTDNRAAYFLVALAPASQRAPRWYDRFWPWRTAPARVVIGYVGCWLIVDEVHISTIAVHPQWRRRGVGEQMLLAVFQRAAETHMALVTLEVRVSNLAAQTLYRKHGFEVVGRRKRYYRDNHEDALLMTAYLSATQRAMMETDSATPQ